MKTEPIIPKAWLVKPVVAAAEWAGDWTNLDLQILLESSPFPSELVWNVNPKTLAAWHRFLSQMTDGDQLWFFSDGQGDSARVRYEGYAIMRGSEFFAIFGVDAQQAKIPNPSLLNHHLELWMVSPAITLVAWLVILLVQHNKTGLIASFLLIFTVGLICLLRFLKAVDHASGRLLIFVLLWFGNLILIFLLCSLAD